MTNLRPYISVLGALAFLTSALIATSPQARAEAMRQQTSEPSINKYLIYHVPPKICHFAEMTFLQGVEERTPEDRSIVKALWARRNTISGLRTRYVTSIRTASLIRAWYKDADLGTPPEGDGLKELVRALQGKVSELDADDYTRKLILQLALGRDFSTRLTPDVREVLERSVARAAIQNVAEAFRQLLPPQPKPPIKGQGAAGGIAGAFAGVLSGLGSVTPVVSDKLFYDQEDSYIEEFPEGMIETWFKQAMELLLLV